MPRAARLEAAISVLQMWQRCPNWSLLIIPHPLKVAFYTPCKSLFIIIILTFFLSLSAIRSSTNTVHPRPESRKRRVVYYTAPIAPIKDGHLHSSQSTPWPITSRGKSRCAQRSNRASLSAMRQSFHRPVIAPRTCMYVGSGSVKGSSAARSLQTTCKQGRIAYFS